LAGGGDTTKARINTARPAKFKSDSQKSAAHPGEK
jgi:hypothetical protein